MDSIRVAKIRGTFQKSRNRPQPAQTGCGSWPVLEDTVIKDIAFTAYPAKDVEKLRAFYADLLGLRFTGPYSEEGVLKYDEAQVGSGWFSLMTSEWNGEGPARSIAFEVDDIEKAFADLRAKGVNPDAIHETPVCKLGSFSDPEGNKVTLHQITAPR